MYPLKRIQRFVTKTFHINLIVSTNNQIKVRLSRGILLDSNNLIVTHGGEDRHGMGLAGVESSLNLTGEVLRVVRELDILTAVALIVHEGAEAVTRDIDKGVLLTGHERNVGSVGGGNDILILLAGEDVDSGKVALGVTVLASLGGRHGRNLKYNIDIVQKVLL
jgi:hypothetical protein